MKATLVGHATVLIDGSDRVLTDPFFGNKILGGLKRKISPSCRPEELPGIDVVVVSHTHPDHYNVADIKALPGKPTILIPWGRGGNLKKLGFTVVQLKPWQSYERPNLKITATPARHMWGHCLGYVIEIDGKKIYFAGDTKLFPDLKKIKDLSIDLALMSYGGYPVFGSTWTTPQAVRAVTTLQPKMCIPIHWGTFNRWWTSKQPETAVSFTKLIEESSPTVKTLVLNVGEKTTLP